MDIESLAAQNPWWTDKDTIKNDDKVKKVLETGGKIQFVLQEENQVIIGPRQLGKTTALKYDIYKKITQLGTDPHSIMYYSLDTARSFEVVSDILNSFVTDDKKRFVYLDEISFVEGWQRAIKQFLDSAMSKNVVLYITGSSSINLKKELMPGRKIRFAEFMPLSFRHFLLSFGSAHLKRFLDGNKASGFDDAIRLAKAAVAYSEEIDKLFAIYINTGGYPDAIFDYIRNGKISEDTYDTHWNAFVSDISKDHKSAEIATAVIYGILESYSSKINLSSIARMQGIKSHVTVREYLELLENLFVSKSIFPVAGKKYVFRKERKVYFNDPFLYNMFAKKTNYIDKSREPKVVEGILFNHLYRFANLGKTIAEPKTVVGFYSGKKEVDFVFGEWGLELKWQDSAGVRDFPKVGIRNRIILSKKTLEYASAENVHIIPLALFLAML